MYFMAGLQSASLKSQYESVWAAPQEVWKGQAEFFLNSVDTEAPVDI